MSPPQLARFVTWSGVFMLIFFGGVVIAITPARGYPLGTAAMLLCCFHSMNAQALLRVLVFRPPRRMPKVPAVDMTPLVRR